MPPSIKDLLANTTEIITFPDVALRINTMVEDQDCSVVEIGEVIKQDPALTVKLLKLANSSYFGFRAEIETVARAVTVLGTQKVRDLALGISAGNAFSKVSNDIQSMENYWRHSILCGLSASALAAKSEEASPDAAFTAGLLHDIGQLIIFNQEPELSKQALLMVEDETDVSEMNQAEQLLLGFDHAELGGTLARNWNLPERLISCIQYHHDPQQAGDYIVDASLIHISNSLAIMAEVHSHDFTDAPPIEPFAWEQVRVSPDIAPEIIDSVVENADELLKVLM